MKLTFQNVFAVLSGTGVTAAQFIQILPIPKSTFLKQEAGYAEDWRK
jgi:hypothetical protein